MAEKSTVNGIDVPMTAQEEAEFIADQQANTLKQQQEEAAHTAFRNQFINILQSCVGVRVDQLTNLQVRALAIYAADRQLGCVDQTNFTIKPLSEFVR